ncbi:MAG: hypothetical protein AMDU4_FER2C00171G0004, partial [Ferroplasma sp. Type II]
TCSLVIIPSFTVKIMEPLSQIISVKVFVHNSIFFHCNHRNSLNFFDLCIRLPFITVSVCNFNVPDLIFGIPCGSFLNIVIATS